MMHHTLTTPFVTIPISTQAVSFASLSTSAYLVYRSIR